MLKNKSKNELIEINYSKEAEIQRLQKLVKKQNEVIEEIAGAYTVDGGVLAHLVNFIILPIRFIFALGSLNNYFQNLQNQNEMKFNKSAILSGFKLANAYEKNEINPDKYFKAVAEILGLGKICKDCGNYQTRLHADFQRRLLNEAAKIDGGEMIRAIKFQCGKYSNGGKWENKVPMLAYSDIDKTLALMEKDLKLFKGRSLVGQLPLLKNDIETLKRYRAARLENFEFDPNSDDALIRYVEPKQIDETEAIAEIVKTEESDNEPKVETVEEVTEVEKITEAAQVEKTVETVIEESTNEAAETVAKNGENGVKWSVEAAAGMREQEMTWKEIGEFFGLAASTVNSRVKKYLDEKNA